MESKHSCPECHLIFEAALPQTGALICPLCNCAFSVLPPRPAPLPPPATSGRQVLRGVVAVGALLFLCGGLGYAYYLMGDIGHKAASLPTPSDGSPPQTESPQPIEVIPINPPAPQPHTSGPQSEPFSPPPVRLPSDIPEVFRRVQSALTNQSGPKAQIVKPKPPVAEPKPQTLLPQSKPPPPLPKPQPVVTTQETRPLTLPERVNRAIERGVAYLRANHADQNQYRNYLGLLGLTLLECGIAADDPSVQQIAGWIRTRQSLITQTYELSLAILFLDRLGEPRDRDLIRTLGLHLLRGQLSYGAWTYSCLLNDQSRPVVQLPSRLPAMDPLPNWPKAPRKRTRINLERLVFRGDNSNTQFAILGLWVAQRYGVSARTALSATAQYFRDTQLSDGSWAYQPKGQTFRDSMTCAGLMSLAMSHGTVGGQSGAMGPRQPIQVQDAAINRGLRYLAVSLDKTRLVGSSITGVDARDPLYFLWSLERLASIYDLKKIGEREWYPWAGEMLVATQGPNGRWPGDDPINTCFALLILKRSNFAKDLQLAVKEPPTTPTPAYSGPIIFQGPDAYLEKAEMLQGVSPSSVPIILQGSDAYLEQTSKPQDPAKPLRQSVTREPNHR